LEPTFLKSSHLGLYCRFMNGNMVATGHALKKTLRTITDMLIAPSPDYKAVRDACAALSAYFCDVSGFDINEREIQQHISTDAGLAVSPYAAAFCITDMLRTRGFIQGIKEAIDAKLNEKPDHPVTVLYAGTGPFATLLTPLTTVYEPAQLQVILMDINPLSIEYLHKIIQHLDIHPYIIDVVQADALSYNIPQKHLPDILVSETMKPGLQKEPQVRIVANLLSQCDSGTFLIPELVKVDVCLAGNLAKDPEAIILLQTLFEFNSQTAKQIKDDPENVPLLAGGVVVEIKNSVENYGRLVLSTAVKIFNDHWLRFNESSLSVRHVLMNMTDIKKFPARLLFKYKMGNLPGFIFAELE
jgi:hypothetical protein